MPAIAYQPAYEIIEADEAETQAGLRDTLLGISEKTCAHSGHATRSVHAKSHGLLRGQLQVAAGLPPELAQGLFAAPATYPVVMRMSTVPGDILDDKVSTPRGLAVKVIGVDGARLPGSEGARTQDFVMVNGPTFLAPGPKPFLGNLKLLAATTDRAEDLKKVLSAVLRGTEKLLEAAGGESGAIKALGGHPLTHPLGETYFTQVPMLYGPYMAKLCVVPVSAALAALRDAPLDLDGKPDGLRDAVIAFFAANGGEWDVRVQLCTNIETMPVEDASAPWPESESPYVTVARLSAPPQTGWSEARSRAVDDGMAFSPWHGLAAHRPLGAIMRARKSAYEASARFRAAQTGINMTEPDHLEDFPS